MPHMNPLTLALLTHIFIVKQHVHYPSTLLDHGNRAILGCTREFWSITVYSLETSSFFLNSTRLTLGSLDKELRKNADGSVDIYFGPKPPAGQESDWLYTPSRSEMVPVVPLLWPGEDRLVVVERHRLTTGKDQTRPETRRPR